MLNWLVRHVFPISVALIDSWLTVASLLYGAQFVIATRGMAGCGWVFLPGSLCCLQKYVLSVLSNFVTKPRVLHFSAWFHTGKMLQIASLVPRPYPCFSMLRFEISAQSPTHRSSTTCTVPSANTWLWTWAVNCTPSRPNEELCSGERWQLIVADGKDEAFTSTINWAGRSCHLQMLSNGSSRYDNERCEVQSRGMVCTCLVYQWSIACWSTPRFGTWRLARISSLRSL